MNLGSLLKRFRKANKLTLKAVAEKAGVSEGFMSQVENNVKSPSLSTLMNICDAVGADIGELMNQLKNQERLFVVSRTEWDDVDLPHTGFATRRFLAPEDRTVLDSAVLFIEPGKSIPVRKNTKNAQEILCVMQGTLELKHGDKVVTLAEGDAAHFWTEPRDQSVTNRGKDLAVVLWMGTM